MRLVQIVTTLALLAAPTSAWAQSANSAELPPVVVSDSAPLGKRPTPPILRSATPIGNPGNWVTTNDYPIRALREEREGIVLFRLTVRKDGTVGNCQIATSSGSLDLDEAACSLVSQRARFRPAQDASGQPTIGYYSSRVHWINPEGGSFPKRELIIDHHPVPGVSVITYTIGANGRARNCLLVSGPNPADFMFWAMPCDFNQIFPVYRDTQGKAVDREVRLVLSVTLPSAAPSKKVKRRR